MALNDFTTVWEDVHALKTEFVRSESNPLVVNIVPGEEIMMLVKIEVELNKPLGTITLCIPVSCFQPIKQKLAGGYREEEAQIDLAWVNSLRDRILETEVEMTVDLGHTHLSIKDLLKLKAGDILILDNHFKKSLPAQIEGIPKFEGFIGSYHRKKVFKVESPIMLS
jgi:flagellar motor switch protein FliM